MIRGSPQSGLTAGGSSSCRIVRLSLCFPAQTFRRGLLDNDKASSRAACHDCADGDAVRHLSVARPNFAAGRRTGAAEGRNRTRRKAESAAGAGRTGCSCTSGTAGGRTAPADATSRCGTGTSGSAAGRSTREADPACSTCPARAARSCTGKADTASGSRAASGAATGSRTARAACRAPDDASAVCCSRTSHTASARGRTREAIAGTGAAGAARSGACEADPATAGGRPRTSDADSTAAGRSTAATGHAAAWRRTRAPDANARRHAERRASSTPRHPAGGGNADTDARNAGSSDDGAGRTPPW